MVVAAQVETADPAFAERHFAALACALLAIMAAAQFAAVGLDSQIVDEGYHLRNGYAFLKTLRPNPDSEHPPLAQAFSALPLLFLDLRIPERPTTNAAEWNADAEFLYHNTYSAETLLGLSRSMKVLLTLGLGAFLGWWTRRHFGAAAGIAALALYCFDPNFIAHGHYVTTDVPAAFGFLVGCLSWCAFLRSGRARSAAICGAVTGLALAVKFSALLLVPLYAFLYLVQGYRQAAGARECGYRCSIEHFGKGIALVLALACATIWAAFAFETRFPVPAPSFFGGIADLMRHNARGHRAYLLGVTGGGGWWYYFPVVALVKTPAGVLLLFLLAVGAAFATVSGKGAREAALCILRARVEWFALAIPPLVYFALCVRSNINIGLRHMLPVYPFAFIWIAAVLFGPHGRRLHGFYRRAAVVLLTLVAIESLAAFPRYTAFFNLPSGGRANGARYVVDSNLDWGQDMFRLRDYLARRGVSNVCLESFGNAPPEHFGIHPKHIPASLEAARADGCLVVMSLSIMFEWQPFDGRFDWLRKLTPSDRVGDSFWVYDVRQY
jgi:hypothetical protein